MNCKPDATSEAVNSLRARLTTLLHRVRGDLVYSAATFLTSVMAFIGSLIATRCLAPDEMGIIQTLMLIPTYCAFLQGGVFNGLNRDIALCQGKGDHDKVQVMVNSSWLTAKAVALIGMLISLVFTAYYVLTGSPALYLWGMVFVFLTLVAEPFSQHLEIVFLSSRQFERLGVRVLWQNAITFVLGFLPLVAGALGLVAARCGYILSRLALRCRGVPIRATGAGSLGQIRELAVIGMPLLFAGVLYMYLGVADRTLVAWYLTPHDVGNLSLAGLVTTSIQFVPACLGTLFYPRIARCYGETGSAAKLRRYFWILLGASVAAVVPACVGIYFIIGPLTEHWLPKYTGGIPAAQVACLSSLGFMYIGVSGVIAVVRRNTPYVLAHLFALLFVWMLGGYLIRHGYGIMGAIWARAIAMLLLCAFSLGFAFWLTAVPGRAK